MSNSGKTSLPQISWSNRPTWHRERMRAWLEEWRLLAVAREQARENTEEWDELFSELAGTDILADPVADEPAPQVGEIRLLHPDLVPGADRPLYVALLQEWEIGFILCAPYGTFKTPGTPGELKTGRKETPLRTLCLWNAVALPPSVLAESWHVDTLKPMEIQEAMQVFRRTLGLPLPPQLEGRVGPPVEHPEDPRIAYQCDEAAYIRPLREAARRVLEAGGDHGADDETGTGQTLTATAYDNVIEFARAELLEALGAAAAGTQKLSPVCLMERSANGPGKEAFRIRRKIRILARTDPEQTGPMQHPDASENCYAAWQLEGDADAPFAGQGRFEILALGTARVLGSGTVSDGVARLRKGHWADFQPYIYHPQDFLLIVYLESD